MYCRTVKEIVSGPVDYRDENNNVYLMEGEEKEDHFIEFKSILLDVLEKEKTFQRISDALEKAAAEPPRVRAKDAQGKLSEERVYVVPNLKPSEIRSLPEGLLFRFRKCRFTRLPQSTGLLTYRLGVSSKGMLSTAGRMSTRRGGCAPTAR
jgi:hypothetical protein